MFSQDYDLYMKPCNDDSDSDDLCSGVREKFGNDACVFHGQKYEQHHVAYCVAWSRCRDGSHNKVSKII